VRFVKTAWDPLRQKQGNSECIAFLGSEIPILLLYSAICYWK